MPYNNDSNNGAGNLLTFLFGIAVGVAGTLVYAAINEEQFQRAVGKTKSLAGNLQDSVNDQIDDISSGIKSVGAKAQDAYDQTKEKVRGKAADVAEGVEKSAHRTKKELES